MVAGYGASSAVGVLSISLAFGFIVTALARDRYRAPVNLAMALSKWPAEGIPAREAVACSIDQMAGASVGAGLLAPFIGGLLTGVFTRLPWTAEPTTDAPSQGGRD